MQAAMCSEEPIRDKPRETVLNVLDRLNEQFTIHSGVLANLSSKLEPVMIASGAEYEHPTPSIEWSEASVVERLLSLESRLQLYTWCVDQMNNRLEIG